VAKTGTIAIRKYILLLPNLDLVLSDKYPISGSETASHTFPSPGMSPARKGESPATLMKKNMLKVLMRKKAPPPYMSPMP